MGADHAAGAPTPLTSWTPSQGSSVTYEPVVAQHRLADLDLFSDASLADLIDHHPRSLLEIFAPDRGSRGEEGWKAVAIGDATGREVLTAVERGRLWVLVSHVHESHPRFAELREQLVSELDCVIPGFSGQTMSVTVLVSSPTATVPYHLDGIPNLLWHIRGEKRAWLYPPDEDEFVDPRAVEDIVVGESPEYLPYDPSFERAAQPIDLSIGQVLAFPHYAPHRVENVSGLNVSLNTDVHTLRTERRNFVRMANRYFSRRLHLPVRSRVADGAAARIKRVVFRTMRRIGLDRKHVRRPTPAPTLRIDPNAPEGVSPIVDAPRAELTG